MKQYKLPTGLALMVVAALAAQSAPHALTAARHQSDTRPTKKSLTARRPSLGAERRSQSVSPPATAASIFTGPGIETTFPFSLTAWKSASRVPLSVTTSLIAARDFTVSSMSAGGPKGLSKKRLRDAPAASVVLASLS